jgi:ABC-type Fe3+-hydroxamate transport system substrate-binding protein
MPTIERSSPERGGHPVVALRGALSGVGHGPPRIVSLVPSLTELICDLGLADCVVGRTAFCVHPERALAGVPRIGGTKTPKLERILELAPTHVLVNVDENRREDAEWLAARVPILVVTHPVEVEDHFELFARLGTLWDRGREAQQLGLRLSEALDRLSARSYDPVQVAYLIWSEPWMTISPDTFIARMLATVGLINVPDPGCGGRYPAVAPERLAARDVSALLLSSEPCRFKLADRQRLLALSALGGRSGPRIPILGIDGEMCSWYGSRVIHAFDYLAGYRRRLEARIARRASRWSAHAAS